MLDTTSRPIPNQPQELRTFPEGMEAASANTTGRILCLPTLRSAVPIGDAARGWCSAIGIKQPIVFPIDTKRNTRGQKELLLEIIRRGTQHSSDAQVEASRISSICVFDQYIDTGRTITDAFTFARSIAEILQIASVLMIGGRWYNQLPSRDFKQHRDGTYTTRHNKFMSRVGINAAQLVLKK